MIKFAKIIIDRKNNEYRNLHFLPEVFTLMLKHERFMYDDYFKSRDLVKDLFNLVEASGRFFWAVVDGETNDLMGCAYFDNFIGNSDNLHSAEINTCFFRNVFSFNNRVVGYHFKT